MAVYNIMEGHQNQYYDYIAGWEGSNSFNFMCLFNLWILFLFYKNANYLEKTVQVKYAVKIQHKPFKLHELQQTYCFLSG